MPQGLISKRCMGVPRNLAHKTSHILSAQDSDGLIKT
jgi:hypothetical protein